MLATLALCVLTHVEPSHFAGALAPDEISERPVAEMTRPELDAELRQLDTMRTGFIGPTVMSGVGGLIVIVGFVLDLIGAIYAWLPGALGVTATAGGAVISTFATFGYVCLVLGTAALVAGGIVLTIGLIRLFPALEKRKRVSARTDDVQHRLDELGGGSTENPPVVVPPPPPPPGAMGDGPLPGILLATF